jgi:hypothetical protein
MHCIHGQFATHSLPRRGLMNFDTSSSDTVDRVKKDKTTEPPKDPIEISGD